MVEDAGLWILALDYLLQALKAALIAEQIKTASRPSKRAFIAGVNRAGVFQLAGRCLNIPYQKIDVGTQAQGFGQIRIDGERPYRERFGVLDLVFLQGGNALAH